jgi:polyisoprenoid-binding protein YceI
MLSLLLVPLLAAPTPSLGLVRYEVDARTSTIGFDGTSTLHDFSGKTHAITGDLRADPADPTRLAGGAVWIEARTLDTGNGSRDDDMREVLDVDHHPQVVFRLENVRAQPTGPKGELSATGRFTIKGVEKSRVVHFRLVPFAAKENTGGALRVQGETRFNMTDHGIERPGILIAKVADEVRVWFDLTLRPVVDEGVEARVRTLHVEEQLAPLGGGAVVAEPARDETFWTSGSKRIWTHGPTWVMKDDKAVASVDPRTGRSQPAAQIALRVMEQLEKSPAPGTTWSTSAEEERGVRTLRITFGEETPARIPSWALDPSSWSNGPDSPDAARKKTDDTR